LTAQRGSQRPVFFEPATSLKNLLGAALVFPEIRCGGLRLEVAQLAIEAGFVKDPSAGPRYGR